MRLRSRHKTDASRPGFTLFEIVLVLALLVALGAIVWPAIAGSFSTARLRTAADRVRQILSEARLEAMRTGTIHEFRYLEGGRNFQVRPWSAEGLATMAAAKQAPPSATDDQAQLPQGDREVAFSQNVLPDDVTFSVGTQYIDQRATLTAAVAGANVGMEGTYSAPILFYPDGTTVDAIVHVKNEGGLYIRIALRGLTGISRSSPTLTADELTEP